MKIAVVTLIAFVGSVAGEGTRTVGMAPLGKCDMMQDCDDDDHCAGSLMCADDHQAELKAAGFDTRLADCMGETTNPKWEVCFDPCILPGKCPSGGSMGDPHFQTFDGTQYSFHGECDLVMARSAEFGSGLGLDVHTRTTMIDDWSLISHAAIRIGNDVLEIVNDRTYSFNGVKNVEFPISMAGKYTVSRESSVVDLGAGSQHIEEYTIDLGLGKIKVIDYKAMLNVNVEALLPGTAGMLGVQGTKGMISRDGAVLDDANAMGLQWQVRDTEAMLFNEVREPQYPQQCKLPNVSSRRLRQSPAKIAAAEEACEKVTESLRKFCIEDVIRSGDASMAHGYLAAGPGVGLRV